MPYQQIAMQIARRIHIGSNVFAGTLINDEKCVNNGSLSCIMPLARVTPLAEVTQQATLVMSPIK
jgi:hypothetical protein